MKRSDLPDLITVLLILMFTYAAFSKLLAFPSFRIQMLIQPVPKWSVVPLIYCIPIAELITVLLLLFKQTKKLGLFSAAGLMIAFTF
ncbi:MauE/DoxX family redox-associated membrane protein, partial [Acinetobacter baumannii]